MVVEFRVQLCSFRVECHLSNPLYRNCRRRMPTTVLAHTNRQVNICQSSDTSRVRNIEKFEEALGRGIWTNRMECEARGANTASHRLVPSICVDILSDQTGGRGYEPVTNGWDEEKILEQEIVEDERDKFRARPVNTTAPT
jgi:hypothetical protein